MSIKMNHILSELKSAATEKKYDEIEKYENFSKMLLGKVHISYKIFELKHLHLVLKIVKEIGIENVIVKYPPKCKRISVKKYLINILNSMKLMYDFYQKNKLTTSFISSIYFTISSQLIPIFIDIFKTSNINYSPEIQDLIEFNREISPAKGFLV